MTPTADAENPETGRTADRALPREGGRGGRAPRMTPKTIAVIVLLVLIVAGVIAAAAFWVLGPRKAAMDFASAIAHKDAAAFEDSLITKISPELPLSERLLEPDVLDAAEPLFDSAHIVDVDRKDRSTAVVTLAVDENGSPTPLQVTVALDDEADGLLPQWKVDEHGWRQLAITVPPGDSTLIVNGVEIDVDELRAPGHDALPLERAVSNDESDRVEPLVLPAAYEVGILADGEHAIAHSARRAVGPLVGGSAELAVISMRGDGIELRADLTDAGRELIAEQLREQLEACLADPSGAPDVGACPELDEDAVGATLLTEDFSAVVRAEAGWWNLDRIGFWYAPDGSDARDGSDAPDDARIGSTAALVVLDDAGTPRVILLG